MIKKVKRFLDKRISEHIEMSKLLNNLENKMEYLFWISMMEQSKLSIEDTKRRVFLDLPKATGELRKVQIINNFILEQIKKICDENGIKFFVCGNIVRWGAPSRLYPLGR